MMRRFAQLCALVVAAVLASAAGLAEPSEGGSGNGSDSSVTVSGHKGVYDDFSNLKITVSQTKNLTAQAIRLTWTGGQPTPRRSFAFNYLSLMQCWGPDPSAADFRETCQFGAGLDPAVPGTKSGDPSRNVFPPGTTSFAQDPREAHQPIPVAFDAQGKPTVTTPSLPFKSATGGTYIDALRLPGLQGPRPAPSGYQGLIQDLFDKNSSNEQPWVPVAGDGTGEAVFWLQSAIEAPHLGCGAPIQSGGQVTGRPCWLVIVPKGSHLVDGTPLTNPDSFDPASPMSETNWENRIAVPLQFDPVQGFCPIGAKERLTVGSELITDAMVSWQPQLCAGGGTAYGYAPLGDATAAQQLLSGFDGAPGLAFTNVPVVPGAGQPSVVHAPVAISGVGIAFLVDVDISTFASEAEQQKAGRMIQDIKLTPRLVAKLLTQSYQQDVPGPSPHEQLTNGTTTNPSFITYDPEFRQLNPDFDSFPESASGPKGLMVVGGNAAAIQQVWRWIIADDQARAWLGGQADEWGMIVNPNFKDYNLATTPPPNFPKADPTCERLPPATKDLCGQDLRPYLGSFGQVAERVLRAWPGERRAWNPLKQPFADYDVSAPSPISKRWALGVTDTAAGDRFSVRMASLRNAAGQFVKPTTDSLLAGVAAMKDTGIDGVLQLDPTANVPAAYPLTMVTYAAVNTQQDQEARNEYAKLLEYAATTGQEPGVERGMLPDGYAPMPEAMRKKTLAVAAQLRTALPPTPPPASNSTPPTDSGTPVPPGDPGNEGGTTNDTTAPPGGSSTTGTSTGTPNPTVSPGQPPAASVPPRAQASLTPIAKAARTSTPPTVVGMGGWILVAILIAGLATALGGAGLRVIAARRGKRPE